MRKYEIHLPLSYDDAKPIERAKIKRACDELVTAFGSFAVPNRRTWKYDGLKYIEIMRIEILTAEDRVPKKLLKDFKERLKDSFRQTDILITTHRIQTAYVGLEIG